MRRRGSGGGPELGAAELEKEKPAFQIKVPESSLTYILAGSVTLLGCLWEEFPGAGTSVTRLLTSLERVAPSSTEKLRTVISFQGSGD